MLQRRIPDRLVCIRVVWGGICYPLLMAQSVRNDAQWRWIAITAHDSGRAIEIRLDHYLVTLAHLTAL